MTAPADPKRLREKRLADALRANLRRRKDAARGAEGAPEAVPEARPGDPDEGGEPPETRGNPPDSAGGAGSGGTAPS